MDQFAKPRMDNVERERELALAALGVGNRDSARCRPMWQSEAQPGDVDEVEVAQKQQHAIAHANVEHHADAATDVLLEARRPTEAFGRMHDLRKILAARIEPRPDLSIGRHVLGDTDDAGHVDIARDWQWAANQACELGEQPTQPAETGLNDLADIHDGVAAGEPSGKAMTHGWRQSLPLICRQQRTKAQVTESAVRSGGGLADVRANGGFG